MIGVILDCLKLLNELREMNNEYKSNVEDCDNLIYRCDIFENIIKKYNDDPNLKELSKEETAAFTALKKVLEEIRKYCDEYKKPSFFSEMTKFAMYRDYTKKLAGLHLKLDRCAQAFHISLTVDIESRRQRDLAVKLSVC
jgi:hypothetical protein